MIDINNINLRVIQTSTRLNEYYPLRQDINVVPAYDLISNVLYTNDMGSDFLSSISSHSKETNEDLRELLDDHIQHSFAYGKAIRPIKDPLFYSYTLVNWLFRNGRNQHAGIMKYNHLLNMFFTPVLYHTPAYRIFRRTGSDTKIIILPGAVYEYDGRNVKLLFCIIVKKEYATDFLFRSSLNRAMFINVNPDSIGLLVDSSFDHKDYPYKGLRSYYRKKIKPMFEERESLIETEDLVSLFKRKVRLPSFLVPEEKEQWLQDTLEEALPI
jgi:hypothetical protein